MKTDEAKEIYKERASTIECVNAQTRNRGLIRLLVRGLEKVKALALWYAIAHNLRRGFSLRGGLALAG
jgi:IS5 family transposase